MSILWLDKSQIACFSRFAAVLSRAGQRTERRGATTPVQLIVDNTPSKTQRISVTTKCFSGHYMKKNNFYFALCWVTFTYTLLIVEYVSCIMENGDNVGNGLSPLRMWQ